MGEPRDTSWTLIRAAAAGGAGERDELARRYRPVVIAYLRARWRGRGLLDDTEDAAQEVVLDLLRPDGALARLDPERGGGFRAFLYGVVRYVALRFEERRARRRDKAVGGDGPHPLPAADETTLSETFDRAWARSLLRHAGDLMARRAGERGPDAVRRVKLLRLRFTEDLPIREIARQFGEDPVRVHHEYAKARREFRAALMQAVATVLPGDDAAVEDECARLLDFFA